MSPRPAGAIAIFVLIATSAAAVPDGAAQPVDKAPRIGVLAPGSAPAPGRPRLLHLDAFVQGLRDLGHIEGRTIAFEVRWDDGKPDRHATLAADLVRHDVDVIVAATTGAALAAKDVTRTIPIVMAASGFDPVQIGLVASLARPGGNITGLTLQTHELPGKRLELLRAAVPGLTRVALLWDPNPFSLTIVKEHEAAARSLGVQLQPLEVRIPGDLKGAFDAAGRGRAQAVMMIQGAFYTIHRARIAELALKSRLPTLSGETGYAQAGGLMEYGPDIVDSWRRAALFVDRILKGAKPGDLPVEQPTKFDLVVNLRTAKALGLTIPPSLVLRADRVVQ